MPVKSNIALSYIAMLSVAGFFLWVIQNFIRGLRYRQQLTPIPEIAPQPPGSDKKPVDWPVHIFLSKSDDIPIPGRLVSLSPTDAFMESSACLHTGQVVTLYIDLADEEQQRMTAQVIWARDGRDGRNAAQLRFAGLSVERKKALYERAGI